MSSAADPNPPPGDWEQFEKLIDLHKFYTESLTKAIMYGLGIVAAILTYVVGAGLRDGRASAALLFPALFSLGAGVIFALSAWKTRPIAAGVRHMQEAMGLKWRPPTELLVLSSAAAAAVFLIVSVALFWVAARPGLLPEPSKATQASGPG
jgi:hypothetical protein